MADTAAIDAVAVGGAPLELQTLPNASTGGGDAEGVAAERLRRMLASSGTRQPASRCDNLVTAVGGEKVDLIPYVCIHS